MPLIIATPSSHPLLGLRRSPDFAAMTPMQVYETLHGSKREIRLLRGIRQLIIGAGLFPRNLPIPSSHSPIMYGAPMA